MATGSVLDDVRGALRQYRRAPGVTGIALLSLALGIGATLALFALVDALLLRTLPIAEPDRLVRVVGREFRPGEQHDLLFASAVYEHVRDRQSMFAAVTAIGSDRVNLANGGEPRYASIAFVDGNYFELLGIRPAHGRLLTPADNRPYGAQVAVISHALWQRDYGGQTGVVGQPVRLDGTLFDIVGVAPRGFFGVEVGRIDDVMVAVAAHDLLRGARRPAREPRGASVQIYARLTSGADFDTAAAAIRAWYPALRAATLPPGTPLERHLPYPLDLAPASRGQSLLRAPYARSLSVLLAAVAAVLFIACINLAVLATARFSDRRAELGIRLSLGASRWRIVRLLLTESLLSALTAGAFGLWLGHALANAVVPYLTVARFNALPSAMVISIDTRLALAALAMAFLAGLVAGALPAMSTLRRMPVVTMADDGRGVVTAKRTLVVMRVLAGGQVALSLALVIGATLLVRSFVELTTRPKGVDADRVLVASLSGDFKGRTASERLRRLEVLRGSIALVPGVMHVSAATVTPLSGVIAAASITVPGSLEATPSGGAAQPFNRVLPGYFETVGMPLLMGRDFGHRDYEAPQGALSAAVINQAFARRHFGGFNPLGRVIIVSNRYLEIVGVVADSRTMSLREDRDVPMAYGSMAQWLTSPVTNVRFTVRAEHPRSVRAGVFKAVADIDPRLTVEVRTIGDEAEATVNRERLLAWLGGTCALLGLSIAVVGLYGTFAYAVIRRQNETGVRAALGADRRALVRLFMRESLLVTASGVTAGIAMAWGGARYLQSLLYGVSATEAESLAFATLSIILASVLATFIPAQRAASVSPMEALRHQ